jgi:hypothetical protein
LKSKSSWGTNASNYVIEIEEKSGFG